MFDENWDVVLSVTNTKRKASPGLSPVGVLTAIPPAQLGGRLQYLSKASQLPALVVLFAAQALVDKVWLTMTCRQVSGLSF